MFEDTTPRSPLDDLKLSELFASVLGRYKGQTVPIGTLVETLHERGFGVLLILFSIPLCIPIPKPPPIDTILGLPLFYLCAQMIAGRDRPTLPKKLMNKPISVDLLLKSFNRASPYLQKFERLFKPRLTNVFSDHMLSRVCGLLGMGLTCSVLVPVPMSNTIPSLCMVVMATGILSRDAAAALAGGLFGIAWVIMLAVLAALGGQWLWHLM